jgi:hypothetical protein
LGGVSHIWAGPRVWDPLHVLHRKSKRLMMAAISVVGGVNIALVGGDLRPTNAIHREGCDAPGQ